MDATLTLPTHTQNRHSRSHHQSTFTETTFEVEPPSPPLPIIGDPDEILDLRPDFSYRPADWRFRLARRVLNDQRDPSDLPRGSARMLHQLLHLLNKCPDAKRLNKKLAHLKQALDIYTADDAQRWTLEAKLLAKIPPQRIAAAMALPLAVVKSYGPAFFDVASRLRNGAFVMTSVVKAHPVVEPSIANILRLYGFHGNPRILDDVLRFLGLSQWMDFPEPVGANNDLRLRAMIALLVTPMIKDGVKIAFMRLVLARHERELIQGADSMVDAATYDRMVVGMIPSSFSAATIAANPLLRLLMVD